MVQQVAWELAERMQGPLPGEGRKGGEAPGWSIMGCHISRDIMHFPFLGNPRKCR